MGKETQEKHQIEEEEHFYEKFIISMEEWAEKGKSLLKIGQSYP